jgi:CheY-like chemotaxis protein
MDIKLPELNGLEATRYIHNFKPDLPIVAQTAYAMDNDREICLKAGCSEYVAKPINQLKLFSLLSKYLQKKTTTKYESV